MKFYLGGKKAISPDPFFRKESVNGKKKAISPLIAIVIIVALVLAIGVFVSIWLSGIVRVQTETAIVSTKPECQFVFLSATGASLSAGNLTFDLSNIGTANVTLNDVRITYTNGSSVFADRTATDLPINITAGDKIPVKVPSVGADISYVRLLTDCSNANIEILGSQIAAAVPTPTVLFFDDFDYADVSAAEAAGWSFTYAANWSIQNGILCGNASNSASASAFYTENFSGDLIGELGGVDFNGSTANWSQVHFAARSALNLSGYIGIWMLDAGGGGSAMIMEAKAGQPWNLTGPVSAPNVTDVLALAISGNEVIFSFDDVEVLRTSMLYDKTESGRVAFTVTHAPEPTATVVACFDWVKLTAIS